MMLLVKRNLFHFFIQSGSSDPFGLPVLRHLLCKERRRPGPGISYFKLPISDFRIIGLISDF